jgi:hypothetical protein
MEQLVSDSVDQTDSDGLILKLLMVYQKILTTVFSQAGCGLVIVEVKTGLKYTSSVLQAGVNCCAVSHISFRLILTNVYRRITEYQFGRVKPLLPIAHSRTGRQKLHNHLLLFMNYTVF